MPGESFADAATVARERNGRAVVVNWSAARKPGTVEEEKESFPDSMDPVPLIAEGRLIGAIGLSDPHGSLARAAGEPEDLLRAADHSLYESKRKRSRQQEPAALCQGAQAGGRDGR